MSLIGQTLDRKRKVQDESRNSIRITGHNGRAWVAESADTFGQAFLLTDADLAAYGARPEPVDSEDAALRKATADAHAANLRSYRRFARNTEREPHPASPEGQFAALAAEAAAEQASGDAD